MRPLLFILSTFLIFLSSVFIQEACAATILLPATGQTKCYNTAGAEIPCAGTGQDGDKKMGVPVDDSNRFITNGNGTITDSLTGLTWLRYVDCRDTVGGITKTTFGELNWHDALTWSNNLASGSCGLSDSSTTRQWRVPTLKELKSLLNRGQSNIYDWLRTKGFITAQGYVYWSSSTNALGSDNAWYVSMNDGLEMAFSKNMSYYVWPVRGGQ